MPAITRSMAFSGAGFIIQTLVLVLAYPFLVHHLGGPAFGIYVLANSMSGIVTMADIGFAQATVKFVAEDMARGNRRGVAQVVVTSFCFYGILALAAGALMWMLAPLLTDLFQPDAHLRSQTCLVFKLASLQFLPSFYISVLVNACKGLQRFDCSSLVACTVAVGNYGTMALGILLSHGRAGLVEVVELSLAAMFLLLLGLLLGGAFLAVRHGIPIVSAYPSRATFQRMIRYGLSLAAIPLADLLLYQAQKYVIGITLGPAGVTIYQLAGIFPGKVFAVICVLAETLFPYASVARTAGQIPRLRTVYLRMLFGSAALALSALGSLLLFSDAILQTWLGSHVASEVRPIMRILVLAYCFLCLSPVPGHLVNGVGRPILNMIFHIGHGVLNILLIGLFLQKGIVLADYAWSFAISSAFTTLIYHPAVEWWVWRGELGVGLRVAPHP